ncbi:hypothetical protein DCS_00246 [Drechmeria coniospora]|uniref:Peptidase S8/S53 domain-containing protein n=1 Tax=Drechmeria coniospora TaxID=98403 RepID=A0A151GPU3_DRECN|nr:hypothetical protein DCS_00246 [Drechmeria coniospora]KYK59116.1 hypothetical protein DCS_00246 [Drechmeria coniospora]
MESDSEATSAAKKLLLPAPATARSPVPLGHGASSMGSRSRSSLLAGLASRVRRPLSGARFSREQQPSASSETTQQPTCEQQRGEAWMEETAGLSAQLMARPRRVRIAILDTGIGRTLRETLRWKDSHGHGTQMASVIARLAPEADISVACVDAKGGSLGDDRIADRVAEAITWAVRQCDADIVSMSFGFAHERLAISKAISAAVVERDDQILFFAAASNNGANHAMQFPARHDAVISINSTDAHGKFQPTNPPQSRGGSNVFGTLGTEVLCAVPHERRDVAQSGSSVATAVASGMAASLLAFADRTNGKVARGLRRRRGMEALFSRLSLVHADGKRNQLYVTLGKLKGISDKQRLAVMSSALLEAF